jgi:hypothetical protein
VRDDERLSHGDFSYRFNLPLRVRFLSAKSRNYCVGFSGAPLSLPSRYRRTVGPEFDKRLRTFSDRCCNDEELA